MFIADVKYILRYVIIINPGIIIVYHNFGELDDDDDDYHCLNELKARKRGASRNR